MVRGGTACTLLTRKYPQLPFYSSTFSGISHQRKKTDTRLKKLSKKKEIFIKQRCSKICCHIICFCVRVRKIRLPALAGITNRQRDRGKGRRDDESIRDKSRRLGIVTSTPSRSKSSFGGRLPQTGFYHCKLVSASSAAD